MTHMMKEQLENLRKKAEEELKGTKDRQGLEGLRIKYLGKKGELTAILKQMRSLSAQERPVIGQFANELRSLLEKELTDRAAELHEAETALRLKMEEIDVTMPGKRHTLGHRHPLTLELNEIKEIFVGMGFDIVSGPEVEYDYYNFEALNMPKDHPARDTQDTFYITDNILLRTQTSPVQVRTMEKHKPPIRIISPGRVYRSDAVDATHSPLFHQIEGLVVDKGITFANLKGTLEAIIRQMYGEDSVVRFRPHHFPFTEPSAEVDVQCFNCHGEGCRLCKGEGWIEILGCGMVHPKVLSNCGIDPEEYSGFAFGMGLERLVMRKYSIDDMRLFYENDVRFLNQF
jgi:phenylalanyl-tRNA synthetase alpha chain